MSAQSPVHQAVFSALRGDSTLRALLAADVIAGSPTMAAVYDGEAPQFATPEDASRFPYIVTGDQTSTEFDSDDIDGQETTITLHVWDHYRGKKRVRQVLDAIYNVLHEATLSVSGQHLVYCYWEFSEVLPEDAPRSQHAVTRFRVVTQES